MEHSVVENNAIATTMSNDNSNSNLHQDSSSGGLDFLGNGSMKDLALKMGDIDKVLDEIHHLEDKPERSNRDEIETFAHSKKNDDQNHSSDSAEHSSDVPNSPAALKDIAFDTDDDDEELADISEEALAQMQAELKQIDDNQEKQQQQQQGESQEAPPLLTPPSTAILGKVVTVTATKPTPDSPLGISMKTSKGVTWIVGISESGLLKNTDLKGELTMMIQTVNGVPIKNARHARSLIQGSPKKVKIVAQEVKK